MRNIKKNEKHFIKKKENSENKNQSISRRIKKAATTLTSRNSFLKKTDIQALEKLSILMKLLQKEKLMNPMMIQNIPSFPQSRMMKTTPSSRWLLIQ